MLSRTPTTAAGPYGPWPGDDDLAAAAAALAARLPDELAPLARLAYGYRWTWMPGGDELFRSVDAHRFELCGANAVRLLQEAPTRSLVRAAADGRLVERAAMMEADVLADLRRPWAKGRSAPAGRPPSSAPSTACTARSRSIPAASVSWPGIS